MFSKQETMYFEKNYYPYLYSKFYLKNLIDKQIEEIQFKVVLRSG